MVLARGVTVAIKPPSSVFGRLQKFFGNTVSSAAGFAAGFAAGPALAPELQDLINETWQLHPSRVPEPGTLASGVAQGQIDPKLAATWASYHGIDAQRFAALVNIANVGPGVPTAFDLWRRGVIDEAGFRRAALRDGLEEEWINDLVQIKLTVLDQAALANAIHRGLIPDPGLLAVALDTRGGNVADYPVYPIDALKEALANGWDHDHLGVLVGLTGLPMGSHEAAQAYFRGVLALQDYYKAIAQGNTRNEWADAIKEQSRQIPTAHEYVENHLRGYSTDADMRAGAARHGMTTEDVELVFQNAGRPLTVRQITTALARGGKFNPEPGEITDPFDASVHESNIKPSYYELAKANRYTYPSAFVLRSLVQTGEISSADAEQVLLYEGWEPTFAHKVAQAWGSGGSGGTSPLVGKAQTQLWTATHKAYVNAEATADQARSELAAIGADAATQTAVLDLWNREREVFRLSLTPMQIKKAFSDAIFTRDEAVTRLERQGMHPTDAGTFLDE